MFPYPTEKTSKVCSRSSYLTILETANQLEQVNSWKVGRGETEELSTSSSTILRKQESRDPQSSVGLLGQVLYWTHGETFHRRRSLVGPRSGHPGTKVDPYRLGVRSTDFPLSVREY